jgi:hypothetical protein
MYEFVAHICATLQIPHKKLTCTIVFVGLVPPIPHRHSPSPLTAIFGNLDIFPMLPHLPRPGRVGDLSLKLRLDHGHGGEGGADGWRSTDS